MRSDKAVEAVLRLRLQRSFAPEIRRRIEQSLQDGGVSALNNSGGCANACSEGIRALIVRVPKDVCVAVRAVVRDRDSHERPLRYSVRLVSVELSGAKEKMPETSWLYKLAGSLRCKEKMPETLLKLAYGTYPIGWVAINERFSLHLRRRTSSN